jgi:arylsulfatase A-like enzyme
MSHINKLTVILSIFLCFFSIHGNDKRPNVLFFLIDDLGWKDLSYSGSTFYETPNIDQLANDGVRFNRANMAAPRCVSSRIGLMTGQVPFRNKLKEKGGISRSVKLMPEAFKEAGYKTYFAGKWHLGHKENEYPDARGFDVNIGGCDYGSPHSYFFPYYKKNSHPMPNLEEGVKGEYLTDRLTEETIEFIRQHTKQHSTQPFFAFLSHYGVHTPLQAKADKIKKYEEKLKQLKKNSQGEAYFQDHTGWVKSHQDHPIYAAMIESIDESVGKLRDTLEKLNLADNTIIVFTSDHGGLSTTMVKKGGGRELATSNLPLRTGKGWLYEGGLRVPFLVNDPRKTGGLVSDHTINGTDVYPTLLDLCGLSLQPKHHLDGFSFAKVVNGEYYKRPEPIIYHYMFAKVGTGNTAMAAVIEGSYKLVVLEVEGKVALYDLEKDPGESNDISFKYPEVTERLNKLRLKKLKDLEVKPLEKNHNFYKTTLKLLKSAGLDIPK